MPDIMHLKVKASPERVDKALTTADCIRGWWTRDADLDSFPSRSVDGENPRLRRQANRVRDRDHFYFQAPGGQVHRLIDVAEDMSK